MPCIGLCNYSWRITSLYLDCWGVCGCLVCIWSNNMFVRVPETTLSSWPMPFFWYLRTLVVNIQYKFLCINSNALSFIMSSLFSQNFSVKRLIYFVQYCRANVPFILISGANSRVVTLILIPLQTLLVVYLTAPQYRQYFAIISPLIITKPASILSTCFQCNLWLIKPLLNNTR